MVTSSLQDHNSLLAASAKTHLTPLGFKRKGRSRLWFKDMGWWLVVIEFQPSSWSKGSYLNVAAMWLWWAKDYWSFDEGGRVGDFREFKDNEQFSLAADQLARAACAQAIALEDRFNSVEATATYLQSRITQNPWSLYAAFAAALAARQAALASQVSGQLQECPETAPWIIDLKAKTRTLLQKVNLGESPREVVAVEIQRCRELLKLPTKSLESLGATLT